MILDVSLIELSRKCKATSGRHIFPFFFLFVDWRFSSTNFTSPP